MIIYGKIELGIYVLISIVDSLFCFVLFVCLFVVIIDFYFILLSLLLLLLIYFLGEGEGGG